MQDISRALNVTIDVLFGYSDPKTTEKYKDRILEGIEDYIVPKTDDPAVKFKHKEESKTESLEDILFNRLFDKIRPYIDTKIKDDIETAEERIMMLLKQTAAPDFKKKKKD